MRGAALALVALALCGCAVGFGGRGPADPLAPPGVAPGPDIVDPLIVGDRLMAAGEPELALDSYIRAAAGPRGPTPDVRAAMARANIGLGRLGQAERLLRDVVDEQPRNAPALNDLGIVLLERGETGEAHRLFQTAFALQPSPRIRENLRVSGARLAAGVYTGPKDDAFTLTRRKNGVYDLTSPGGPSPGTSEGIEHEKDAECATPSSPPSSSAACSPFPLAGSPAAPT